VAPEPPAVIEVHGVSFGYGSQPVLEDVELAIGGRDFLAIVGPNGGGKTTLLKVILGLLKPWRGEVVRRLSGRRGAIGYVPQFSSFDRNFPRPDLAGSFRGWSRLVREQSSCKFSPGRRPGLSVCQRAASYRCLSSAHGRSGRENRKRSGQDARH